MLLPLEQEPVDASTRRMPAAGALLSVAGAEVTAVLRDHGALVVRMVRVAADAGFASIRWNGAPARGWLVDLTGRPLAEFDSGVACALGDRHRPPRWQLGGGDRQ